MQRLDYRRPLTVYPIESILADQFKSCKGHLRCSILFLMLRLQNSICWQASGGGRDHGVKTIIVSDEFYKQTLHV